MTPPRPEPRPRPFELRAADGVVLEAEIAEAGGLPAVVAVLCHPHPQYGGSMRSIVTAALFAGLPAHGIACVRFNFRGVEGSGGEHAGGHEETLDVVAAIDGAAATYPHVPIVLIGWSFGADMALAVDDPRVAGWVGIAPPLRFGDDAAYASVAGDARPKLLVLAAHDEFRAPGEIESETSTWVNRRVHVIAGASHFFVGRTDHVVAEAATFAEAFAR